MRSLTRLSLAIACLLSLAVSTPALAELSEQTNLFELGAYGGVAKISSNHEFYDQAKVQRPFKDFIADAGARFCYLPLSWLGAEVEGGVLPGQTKDSQNALLYTVRGHVLLQLPLTRYLVPFVLGGGGFTAVSSDQLGNDMDGTLHWGGGLKSYLTHWLVLRVDGRHLISHKNAPTGLTSSYELLAGLGVVFGWAGPHRPGDTDGDGLTDDIDQCPTVAAHTHDGCPVKDSDGDGVTDDQDKCPTVAASTPDGCPLKDSDGDGITDDKDKCPRIPANTPDGCPLKDTDNDGITDDKDMCPTEPETRNGFEDDDGCPDEIPQQVKKFTGAIKGIHFANNSAEIKPDSFTTLNQAAEVLKSYPTLRLAIRGHTDSRGSRDHNVALSLKRAEAVKTYLSSQGIPDDRLSVEGIGPDEPIANNRTRAGRAENRRIEFRIIVADSVAPSAPAAPGITP